MSTMNILRLYYAIIINLENRLRFICQSLLRTFNAHFTDPQSREKVISQPPKNLKK